MLNIGLGSMYVIGSAPLRGWYDDLPLIAVNDREYREFES